MSTYQFTRARLRKALGLGVGSRHEHQRPGRAQDVALPRVVIRGETNIESPSRGETQPDGFQDWGMDMHQVSHAKPCETETDALRDWDQSESLEYRPGRNGQLYTISHPIPTDQTPANVAHVDALTFTLTPPEAGRAALNWLFPALVKFFGISFMKPTGKGFNGYKDGYDLGNGAMLGIGGQNQRGTMYVSLMGAACARVPDWSKVQMWGESVGAKITRIDLAHDDHEGKTVNIEQALQWHREGGFKNGGRPPTSDSLGDWFEPGSPKGRTLNIGARGNGKMIRFYEKGKQLGDRTSPWVRAELELRAQNRVIPWNMLTRPGQYLAGAYPCLKFLSALQDKVKTVQKAARISLERATENLRHLGGSRRQLAWPVDDNYLGRLDLHREGPEAGVTVNS
jgi:phage replication initiation protein